MQLAATIGALCRKGVLQQVSTRKERTCHRYSSAVGSQGVRLPSYHLDVIDYLDLMAHRTSHHPSNQQQQRCPHDTFAAWMQTGHGTATGTILFDSYISMTTGKVESKKPAAKRQQRTIQVITCPSEFPGASDHRQPRVPWEKRERTKKETVLRWHETAHEIHALGAQGFQGKLKKKHEADEYERLTGMKKKQQKVPLPIVRGIQKKAAQRQDRLLEEARAAGLVLPNTAKRNKRKKKERDRTSDIHGPAPSIGFVNKGVFKYKDRREER